MRKLLLEDGMMGKVYAKQSGGKMNGIKDKQKKYGLVRLDRLFVRQVERQSERKRERWEIEMEEGSCRCGGASGDTSHYGVSCSSGDVLGRVERSPAWDVSSNTCTHTHRQAYMHTEEIERTSGYVPPA